MKPIKEIRKTHRDAIYYNGGDNSNKIQSIVIADKQEGDKPWYYNRQYFEFIPAELVEEVNRLRYPIISSDFDLSDEDELLLRDAADKVFICQITSIIESQPFLSSQLDGYKKVTAGQDEKILFNDIFVAEPVDVRFKGLKVYIPQMKAGVNQPVQKSLMIGQLVPVKIVETWQVKEDARLSKDVSNNYVVEGSVFIGESLRNALYLLNLKKARKNGQVSLDKFLGTEYMGVVTRITVRRQDPNNPNSPLRGGVYFLTNQMFTVFVPVRRFSYKVFSRFLDIRDIARVGDRFKIKVTHTYDFDVPPYLKSLLKLNTCEMASGECISFEKNPYERMAREIDNNNFIGTYHRARVVDFDIIKGHLVELEDYPGILIKLKHVSAITQDMVNRGQPLTVMIDTARYYLKDESLGYVSGNFISKISSAYKVSVQTKPTSFTDFFK